LFTTARQWVNIKGRAVVRFPISTRTFNSLPAVAPQTANQFELALESHAAKSARKLSLESVNEALLVLTLLSTIAWLSGSRPADWLGAAAVLVTFLHGQLSFDMQESQRKMAEPTVANYHWSGRLFVTKELLWIMTFIMTGSWPLCAGSVIFATYPRWRFNRNEQK